MNQSLKEISNQLVHLAQQSGALHADALSILDAGESVQVRHGALESVEREDSQGVGLRAFVETPQGLAFASASSSDVSEKGLKALAKQVVSMANISEPDPDAMPPEGAKHPTDEDMQAWACKHPHQHHGWDLEAAKEAALLCEQAGLDYSDRISNSEGANASFGETSIAYAASDGFMADYQRASSSLSISVIAGEGEMMQRDYAYTRSRQARDLRSAEEVGHEAAQRTLRMLGASGLSSRTSTVIFEPRVATSILGHLASAINGRSVLQKNSFLSDALNESVFPDF
ncbi:MAG: metallopeptidase TldD-related protein, partial [Mariprofundaceae bacterium]|nr:metallopeptidase TldD-related protein [Mariprofundaceae bacterium]